MTKSSILLVVLWCILANYARAMPADSSEYFDQSTLSEGRSDESNERSVAALSGNDLHHSESGRFGFYPNYGYNNGYGSGEYYSGRHLHYDGYHHGYGGYHHYGHYYRHPFFVIPVFG